MKPFRDPARHTFKLRLVLPDGRRRNCSLGTDRPQTARAITRFVEGLFSDRRWPVLTAIQDGRISIGRAYDYRHDLDALLASLDDLNIEPYVAKWHAEKAKARKGAASAHRYERQLRRLITAGTPYPLSRFTRKVIDTHLRKLPVDDPTRNRHRAAFMSFAKYLVREDVLPTNVVRDIEGWSEGPGRFTYMERDQAQATIAALQQPYQAIEALMVGAGLEWQAIAALRVRDVDLDTLTVLANGEKTGYRRRLCRIVERWTVPYIRPALADKLPSALLFAGVTNRRALEQHDQAVRAAETPVSTLHDWRHTHAVLMLRDRYPPMTVAHQLGHATTALVWKRYGRFVVDERDYLVAAPPIVPPKARTEVR